MHLLLLYIDVLALPFFRSPHDCCCRLRGPPLAFFLIPLMIPSSCSLRCALCIALLPPLRCCATRSSGGCGLLRFRVDLPTRTSRLCGCYQEARWEVGDGKTTESKGMSGRWGGARKHGQRGRAQACLHFLPPPMAPMEGMRGGQLGARRRVCQRNTRIGAKSFRAEAAGGTTSATGSSPKAGPRFIQHKREAREFYRKALSSSIQPRSPA